MIVLDTHVLIWWLSNPERLSEKAREIIERSADKNAISISSISTWEIAMLVLRNRLELTMDVRDWIMTAESLPYIQFIPLNNNIVIKSVQLNDFPSNDHADRIIIATALTLKAPIITRDDTILNYTHIKTIW